MTYSGNAKYRNAAGILTISTEQLTFTRVDGIFSKREVVVVTLPTDAILNIDEKRGFFSKKIVVLVDNSKVPGIPRHEFEVGDPTTWISAIRKEMMGKQQQKRVSQDSQQITTVKEIIKEKEIYIRCPYCKMLVREGTSACPNCGAKLM